MKKNIIVISIILLIIESSCTDEFLNETDPTRITSSGFYNNASEITQAVNGVYSKLQDIMSAQFYWNEMISDNTTIDYYPPDRHHADGIEAFEFYTITPSNRSLPYMYNTLYSAIHNINTLLLKLSNSNISDPVKNESIGQIKFLRAYFYYQLTQYFGDVVLITEPLASPQEAWNYERESQDKVYAQIENDLIDAIDKLPVQYNNANVGRVTKGAALTLLGKIHLTNKQYTQAIETLKQVLTLGYALLPSYADIFNPANKNSVESIYEVQYQGGNDLGEHSNFIYMFAPRLSMDAVTGWPQSNPDGWNIPTKDLINAYEEGDLRKDASIGLDFISPVTGLVVPYIKKYAHPHSIYGRTDNNWPVLRYSDVLLMLAESINELDGPTSEAYGYLNEVRERADLEPISGLDQQSFRIKVFNERRVELAFENWRWFDLKRTKTPAELTQFINEYIAREKADPTVTRQGHPFLTDDYIFEEYEIVYPLPFEEFLVNKDLIQNPGY